MPYMLSCDSTTDLTLAQYAALDLHYVSLHFLLDGKEYPDDYGQSLPMKTFFDAMAAGATTGTSQVTTGEFELYFRQFLEQGSDILHVSLSSGLSGCYHSACAARDMLLEEFPERKIIVVDSLCGSGGAAILMLEAARQRDAGRTMEETAAWIEARRLHVHHWLFTPELAYFVRGGRVSAAAGWIGTLLRLCPVIEANCEGKLNPREKIRGKQRALRVLVEKMVSYAEGGMAYDGPCHISHADNLADAEQLAGMIEEKFPQLRGRIVINTVGTTLGSHCGPGMVALFFYGTERGR